MNAILLMIAIYTAGCIALIVLAFRRSHKEPDDLARIIEEIEAAPLHDGGLLMRETQIDLKPISILPPERQA